MTENQGRHSHGKSVTILKKKKKKKKQSQPPKFA